jgi:hypothetical protein
VKKGVVFMIVPPRSDSSSLKSEEKRAKHDRQENLEDEQKSFSPPSPAVGKFSLLFYYTADGTEF